MKKVATAGFARSMGILLASGVPLLTGLEVTKKVIGNSVLIKGLSQAEENIKKGRGMAESIAHIKAFPPMLLHMVKVGEESGTLDYILEKTADFFDDEVEAAVARMTTLLEPAIIISMSVVVSFIIVSIIMPMFDMMTSFSF